MRIVDWVWLTFVALVTSVSVVAESGNVMGWLFMASLCATFIFFVWIGLSHEIYGRAEIAPFIGVSGAFLLALLRMWGWSLDDSLRAAGAISGVGGTLALIRFLKLRNRPS